MREEGVVAAVDLGVVVPGRRGESTFISRVDVRAMSKLNEGH